LLTLYMVDLWAHNASQDYLATGDWHASRSDQREWNRVLHVARRNTRHAGTRAKMIRADSATAAVRIADGTLDFAFIDDDHSLSGCTKSITAWLPKIKPGGFLSGHDYKHPRFHFGVTEAVHAFFDPRNMPVERDKDFTWFVRIPKA